MATTETVQKLLVDGEWYETGETIDVTSPFDGSVVGRVAYGGADDARRAIDAAERAMREAEPTAQVIYVEPDIYVEGHTPDPRPEPPAPAGH